MNILMAFATFCVAVIAFIMGLRVIKDKRG